MFGLSCSEGVELALTHGQDLLHPVVQLPAGAGLAHKPYMNMLFLVYISMSQAMVRPACVSETVP